MILVCALGIFVTGCSTRQVYETSTDTIQLSPDAININTATADELEKLPHIGRKTAEAIVEFRVEHGAFRRVEHLMLIRGVSEARFAEIRPLMRAR
jgi:competence ComEA-like helix-hairpin-helix protein